MKTTFNQRANNGTSLIELCAGLIIAIPVFLLLVDCAILIMGLQINDKTCREAARVAASGLPASAELRAQNIVSKADEEKMSMIADLRLVSVVNTLSPVNIKVVQLDGGTISGTVTVTTAAEFRPFFGQWLLTGQKCLTFQSTQSFPYTSVMPNPASVNE